MKNEQASPQSVFIVRKTEFFSVDITLMMKYISLLLLALLLSRMGMIVVELTFFIVIV